MSISIIYLLKNIQFHNSWISKRISTAHKFNIIKYGNSTFLVKQSRYSYFKLYIILYKQHSRHIWFNYISFKEISYMANFIKWKLVIFSSQQALFINCFWQRQVLLTHQDQRRTPEFPSNVSHQRCRLWSPGSIRWTDPTK